MIYHLGASSLEWHYESFPLSKGKSSASTYACIPKKKNQSTSARGTSETPVETQQPLGLINLFDLPDSEFTSFTGISRKVFELLLHRMDSKLKSSRGFSKEGKLASVFIKLKLNLAYKVIAAFFRVSRQAISKVFNEVVPVLSLSLKDFIIWYDKATIRARMPASFVGLYPDTMRNNRHDL